MATENFNELIKLVSSSPERPLHFEPISPRSSHHDVISHVRCGVKEEREIQPTGSSDEFYSKRMMDIQTGSGDFELSADLRRALITGLLPSERGGNHPKDDGDILMARLLDEVEDYADRKKREVRAMLKNDNLESQKDMIPRDRSLLRSRIEAKVSRVKAAELEKGLKIALRWLIRNTDTAHPQPCFACPR